MGSLNKLERLLKKDNIATTPSALNILKGCLSIISPEQLATGIRREHPELEEIDTPLAVKILSTWYDYVGIDAKPLVEELSRVTNLKKSPRISISLFQTLCALNTFQEQWVTATQVAEETGRKRATESTNLNKLKRMRRVKKKKEGNKAYFQFSG
ncbi:MAG: hypothetical protein ACFFC7_10415 [Candidatus Hermodarchaeota archaeon]